MRYIVSIVVLFLVVRLSAQQDTLQLERLDTAIQEKTFNPKQLIAPALLVGMGTLGLIDDTPIDILERRTRDDLNPHDKHTKVDEYIQYIPTGAHLVLGFIPGVKAKHNFRDRLIASATANLLMAGITNGVKYTVKERRPDSTKDNSFFSGHTATAFTGAELMRIEYGWGYGAAAYAVAATTGFLRVYNKRHWVGDVFTGAGIGILSANAGYWMLPVWKRWLKLDKKKESKRTVVAAPFYLQDDKAAGLSCSIVL